MTSHLEVLATGPLTLVQDAGRPGLAAVGVGRSGAADRGAFRLGARLVGQSYDGAALEVTLGGLSVRARGAALVALTGAEAPALLDGRPVGYRAPVQLRDGQTLTLGTPATGLRTYLAVRGGVAVPATLGSRSTDTLAGLGPPAVRVGDLLPVGPPPPRFPDTDLAPGEPPSGDTLLLRALPGPRADWLADPAALAGTGWTVSERSDRVGLRLTGTPLAYAESRHGQELSSEGVVRGAVQVPAGGQPVLFLADHPVTGGYPVVAVLTARDADRAAQARPGQGVRLQYVPA